MIAFNEPQSGDKICSPFSFFFSTHSFFILSVSLTKIDNISKDELESLIDILNTPRQREVENYYWNLGGECEFDTELTLVGMMINSAKVTYIDNVLTISIIREES